jgi:hypothetical protein
MTVSAGNPPRQPLRAIGRNLFAAPKNLSQLRGDEAGQEVEILRSIIGN